MIITQRWHNAARVKARLRIDAIDHARAEVAREGESWNPSR